MKITIQTTGAGCTLSGTSLSCSWQLPLPIGAGDLTALLASLLADPEKHKVEDGPVHIVRREKGVSIRTSAGSFDIPWPNLFAIQGIPA